MEVVGFNDEKDYNKDKEISDYGACSGCSVLFVGVCIYLSKMGKPRAGRSRTYGNGDRDHRDKAYRRSCSEATEEQPVTEQIHDTEMQSEPETEADTITPGQDNTSKSEAEAPVEKPEVSNEEALTKSRAGATVMKQKVTTATDAAGTATRRFDQ